MHQSFRDHPGALRHAFAVISLPEESIGEHFEHCVLKAVRNLPGLAGPAGLGRDAFEPFPMERE